MECDWFMDDGDTRKCSVTIGGDFTSGFGGSGGTGVKSAIGEEGRAYRGVSPTCTMGDGA